MIFTTFKEKDCKNLNKIVEMYKGKTTGDLYKDLIKLRDLIHQMDQKTDESGKWIGIKNKKELAGIVYRFLKELNEA